jgi:tetratricopeptide (TPR) repeat protein
VLRVSLALLLLACGCVVVGPPVSAPRSLAEAAARAPTPERRASIRLAAQAGQALERQDPGSAQTLLERALRVDGRNPYAYLVLGETLMAQGDLERARRHLEQATTLFRVEEPENAPWQAHTLRRRADLLVASGQASAAARLRHDAERLDPGGHLDAAPAAVIRSEP